MMTIWWAKATWTLFLFQPASDLFGVPGMEVNTVANILLPCNSGVRILSDNEKKKLHELAETLRRVVQDTSRKLRAATSHPMEEE